MERSRSSAARVTRVSFWMIQRSDRRRGVLAELTFYTVVGAVGSLLFYRAVAASGFDAVPGDVGDARLLIVVLEHWKMVFEGDAAWHSPVYFFPLKGTLGYADAEFAMAVPFVFLRWMGQDMFTSFQLTLMLYSSIGFVGMIVLLRRCLALDPWSVALGSYLFAYSNAQFLSTYVHAQMTATNLLPLLAIGIWLYVRGEAGNGKGVRRAAGLMTLVLLALIFFTAFYIGWFVVVFAGLFTLIAVSFWIVRRDGEALVRLRRWLRCRWPELAVGSVIWLVAMTPFFVAHLPVRGEFVARPYAEVKEYLPRVGDLLSVGPENTVWGGRLGSITGSRRGRRSPFVKGLPAATLAFFLLSGTGVVVQVLRRREPPRVTHSGLMACATTAVLVSWCLILRTSAGSAWWLMRQIIPGGDAIRIVFRYQLVLLLAISVVMAFGWSRLLATTRRIDTRAARWAVLVLLAVVSLFLVAEQLQSSANTFSKARQLALLEDVGPPPEWCDVFFVAPGRAPSQQRAKPNVAARWFEMQHDAMLLAVSYRLPTINGRSGWLPRGWGLARPWAAGYPDRVRRWLRTKLPEARACAVDLSSRSWLEPGTVLRSREHSE